ncbi:SPASM domain-containing protein [Candidatus Latescibacterota bacterium]
MRTTSRLRDYLRGENPQLADLADRLWESEGVKTAHSRSNRPDANESGYEHCTTVETNIWKFITDLNREEDFTDTEICLLSCGACCHDLDKGLQSALKSNLIHGQGSQQYVSLSKDLDSILTMPWRNAISEIIAYHDLRSHDFWQYITNLDRSYCIGSETINLQRLAIILKAGDILHTDASRVPLAGIEPMNMDINDRMKSKARSCITGWRISGANVILLAKTKNKEEEYAVRTCHGMICRDDWASVEPYLDQMHFPHLLQLRIRSNGKQSECVVEYWETQSRLMLYHEKLDQLLERYRNTEQILLKSQVAQEIVRRAENLREDNHSSEEAIALNRTIVQLLYDASDTSLRNCRSEALYNLSTSYAALYHETGDKEHLEVAWKSIKESIALGNRTFNYACILVLMNDIDSAFEELKGCLERREVKWDDVEKDEEWKLLRDEPQYKELKRRWGNEDNNDKQSSGMRPSKFNVHIPSGEGHTIIWNTFSDSRILADAVVLETIDQCADPSGFSSTQHEYMETLAEMGFVLDNSIDEDHQVEYWFQRLRYDTKVLDATILTTMGCNMSCVYCFQQGTASLGTMNADTTSLVCRWLLDRVDEIRPKILKVTLFGGEPLLNLDTVFALSEGLFKGVKNSTTRLSLDLITNGLLLNHSIIEKLGPLGLERVKVTLDGDMKTHNRLRPRKGISASDKGSYEAIVSNLEDIRGRIPIYLRGNYDPASKNSIPALLDDLLERGFLPEHFEDVAFKPITGFPGHEISSSHSIGACSFSQTHLDDFLWLINEVESRGFPAFKGVSLGPCEAMLEHSFAIAPNGDLYKCSQLVGREEYSIGNIKDNVEDIFFSRQNVDTMLSAPWRQCRSCKFVPICRGGCRLAAISAGKRFDAVSCEKDYFEKVATKLIQLEYQGIH